MQLRTGRESKVTLLLSSFTPLINEYDLSIIDIPVCSPPIPQELVYVLDLVFDTLWDGMMQPGADLIPTPLLAS
jgi:hypothetical protein